MLLRAGPSVVIFRAQNEPPVFYGLVPLLFTKIEHGEQSEDEIVPKDRWFVPGLFWF
jgi:hypothetical protein